MISIAPAANAAPRAGRSTYGAAIEPLAAYEPQTTCSVSAKPGMADLAARILKAYPGTRSMGIVRACGVGGRSEHKEGRAFDWGVSVHNARDRAAVKNFTTWLLATDKHGNRYAMARRLGVQYVIWNKRIWGSYAGSAGWRPYSGASPHTDHVHISLTRAGGDGRTSFWTKRPAKVTPAPVYTPPPKNVQPALRQPAPAKALLPGSPLEFESLELNARSSAGARTHGALTAGETYLIEAHGTWQYGKSPGALADAECSRSSDGTWRRDRSVHALDVTSDHLDLYVDGVDLLSSPDVDTGRQCDENTHTYRWEYRPTRTGRVSFQLWDPGTYRDNSGGLTISVRWSVPRAEMSWSIPAASATGAMSPGSLEAGSTYVATVTGTYDVGDGATADAECALAPGGSWEQTSATDLHMDGRNVTAEPAVRDAAGCSSLNNTYRFVLQPRATKHVNVRATGPNRAAHVGALEIRVVKVGPVSGPESLTLNTSVPTGVTTARNYPAGQPLLVTVGGTYTLGTGMTADAECTTVAADPVWRTYRSTLVDDAGRGLGDVTVNGRTGEWEPVGIWPGCEPSHAYTWRFTPSQAGPLVLSVADTDFSDNAGLLSVTVEPAPAQPAVPPVTAAPIGPATLPPGPALKDETLRVDAVAGAATTAGSFTAGETYLIEVSGTYQYAASPDAVADGECSRSPSDATWRRDRSVHRLDASGDHLDLFLDGVDPWAKADTGYECDVATHLYRWEFTPTRTGRMTFQLWDPGTYADNSGGLDIRVIRYADKAELVWTVPAASATGSSSPGALQAGETYVATVSGRYDAGNGIVADAECSSAAGTGTWQLDRSVLAAQPTADHLDLLVDRKDVAGRPVAPSDVPGCDPAGNSYRFVLKPTVTRPVNMRVYDPAAGDNSGGLTVRVAKVVPVTGSESLALDTASARLLATARNYESGKPLLITVTGTYAMGGGITADAECSVTATDSTWRTGRSILIDSQGRALGDVTVNGSIQEWRRPGGTSGCDSTTHRYTVRYTPNVPGPIAFSVADTDLADNAGALAITIEPTV